MIEKLIHFINNDLLEGAADDLDQNTPLLELGILDSLSMVLLLAHIDQQYGVKIPEHEINPEHFENVATLAALINQLSKDETAEAMPQQENVSELARLVKLQETYNIESQMVEVGGGLTQHALRVKGNGPLWVMLPALGNPSTSWSPLLRSVQNRHNAVALDLAGFGLTQSNKDNPSFKDHVNNTLQYLETIEEQEWVLIANSAGSMVAAEVARRFPEKVKALVITGFGLVEDVEGWWQGLKAMSKKPEEFLEAAYYNPPKLTPDLNNLLNEVLSRPAYHNFLDTHAKERISHIFDGITVPTLFIAGNHDQIVPPEWSEKAAESMEDASVVRLSRCGHFSASERPEEFIWVVEDFLMKINQKQNMASQTNNQEASMA
ncbi:alpha/beta fold hydrolase [Marinomonas mediterranea]|jgi:Predicted hydrolases or acyltransferases (alpha/beta hydrolase superfamily)|uniref:Alpha/beta hydrolase fold protein n=2 Tax=Marinomonas mediterranea (strain ATCC 700492 / JCM 21426 / NBRC 103028 / MMB-1) TaxID=717774 RepID=F2K074_MARM1|nr:alpha/beta fold hydrolase [Marinomonas mediterranea]ADZ93288.1 alpha/beta hydrolase fold protein [Marinomonas mediterranea MMB-1]WCN15240.1 alpha/beta fold hydrolase [Marinomonas mediterranea]WCN19286.1 alpha/beta fold hydrolase [Marinomonas mediterranea MMB-1]